MTSGVLGAFAAPAPSLVVGVGASRGAPVGEVLGLVEEALRDAGLRVASVVELATVDGKAGEPGIVGAAERLGVPLVAYPADELADVQVPHPSDASLAATGTPSVAEAAALARGGELLVPKRKSAATPAMATCAVVRRPGPGTPSVVGLERHVDRIRDPLGPGTRVLGPGPEKAAEGHPWTNCASCGHRIALPGFEDGVGLPQQPRFHPDDGGRHHHGHHHTHGHAHSHAH